MKMNSFQPSPQKRENISVINDLILILLMPRSTLLQDLHYLHLEVDEMKSLAQMTYWWTELNADIVRTAKKCKRCLHKQHPKSSKYVSWPVSCASWKRVYADCCDLLVGKYYAMVVVDASSQWPEVDWTKSPTSKLTQNALHKIFSRGVPFSLVTENGTRLTAKPFNDWFKGLGYHQLFIIPLRSQSRGPAKKIEHIQICYLFC